MSNASRFISAYNKIDRALRTVYDFKPSMAFSDAVRKASALNPFVQRVADELLSYARLRNAIVHNSEDEKIIAEPLTDVTTHIERIADILTRPPRASKFMHTPASVQGELALSKTIAFMTRGNYSNVPVLRDDTIIGVVTNKMIVSAIEGRMQDDLASFIAKTPVERILTTDANHYQIASKHITADEVLTAFSKNRKLAILILTENGKADGKILGVLTVSDLSALRDAVD